MARIFPRQWNLIKLRSISCCEIMRCSCAVGSVILPSSKPLAGLAVQLNYCTNGEVVKQYYIARNVLSLRQSLEWWKTSFGAFYSSICCLKTLYESDHFEKFALTGNCTRPFVLDKDIRIDQSRDEKNGRGHLFEGFCAPLSWVLQFISELRRLWS